MGLSLETLRLSFPKSTVALEKHHALIERLASCDADRQSLKASANMLVLIVSQEMLERAEVVSKAKASIELIRGLFGK